MLIHIEFANPTAEEKSIAALVHIFSLIATSLLLNLIVPIVVLCLSTSPFVRKQAKEALNFQISVVIWAIISFLLCFFIIGIPMLAVLAIAAIVLPICAAISVAGGCAYRYPLTFRLVQ